MLLQVEGGYNKKWATQYGIDASRVSSKYPSLAEEARKGAVKIDDAKAFYWGEFWQPRGFEQLGKASPSLAVALFVHLVHGAPFETKGDDLFDLIARWLEPLPQAKGVAVRVLRNQFSLVGALSSKELTALRLYLYTHYPDIYAARAALAIRAYPDAQRAGLYARFEFERRIIGTGKLQPVSYLEELKRIFSRAPQVPARATLRPKRDPVLRVF